MLRSITVPDGEAIERAATEGYNAIHVQVPDPKLPLLLEAAARRGLTVHARVRLLAEAPSTDTCPVNAVGELLRGFECPSQPLAQDRSLERCQRVASLFPWASMQLVGLGFQSFDTAFYSNICFCSACQYGYGAAGAILEHVAREAMIAPVAKHPSVDTMLMWRRSVQYGLLRQIRDLVSIPLCLHTAAELRYTGDKSSLTFEEAKGLVASCSVSSRDPIEMARLAALPRPMPVYCDSEQSASGFSGFVIG